MPASARPSHLSAASLPVGRSGRSIIGWGMRHRSHHQEPSSAWSHASTPSTPSCLLLWLAVTLQMQCLCTRLLSDTPHLRHLRSSRAQPCASALHPLAADHRRPPMGGLGPFGLLRFVELAYELGDRFEVEPLLGFWPLCGAGQLPVQRPLRPCLFRPVGPPSADTTCRAPGFGPRLSPERSMS